MINIKDVFRVKFGGGANSSALVIAKGDDTRNRDGNKVKTSFLPGDPIYFYVHHEAAVRIKSVRASAGTAVKVRDELQVREETVEFEEFGEKVELEEIPEGGVALEWKGNVGREQTISGRMVSIQEPFPAVAMARYKSRCHIYKLQTPAMSLAKDQRFPLLIVVYMEAA